MKKKENYFSLGIFLLVMALVLAGYFLKLRIYEETTDPNFLKSPNEVKSASETVDQ